REVNGSPILGPWYAILAATGVILAAIYLLFLVGKIVFGPLNLPHWEDTGEKGIAGGKDLSYREAMTLTPIAVVCVVIGLFPYPILRSLEPAIQEHTQYVHDEIDRMEAETQADEPTAALDDSDLHAKTPSRQDAKEELDDLSWLAPTNPEHEIVWKDLQTIGSFRALNLQEESE
ncbi:MAG: hypothetical protein AAGC44_12020, partial [Planctomycetota bacterium]